MLALTRAVAVAGVALVAGGCHTYRVMDHPPVGSIVRVHVPVTSPLGRAPEITTVEGQLLDDGDVITLATSTRRQLGAYRELMQYDTLRLAQEQVSAVELREFSTARSVLLGVGIAAGATLGALYGFGLIGGADPPDDPGVPPPVAAVVQRPFLSFAWGLPIR